MVRGGLFDPHILLFRKELPMLRWAVIFLIIALVAGVLGLWGLEGIEMQIARILFFVFPGSFYSVLGNRSTVASGLMTQRRPDLRPFECGGLIAIHSFA